MDDITKYYRDEYHKTGYKMASWHDSSRVLGLKEWILSNVAEGSTIVDVGCGDMYLSTILPQYKWVGVDINTKLIPEGANFIEHDIAQVPYPIETGSVDAVVCSEVLEHVWDLRVIHAEVRRILKNKGKYIISTPNYDHIDFFVTHYREMLTDFNKPHTIEHIRQYNVQSHVKYLIDCGFKPLEHKGADAQYTHMFVAARQVLHKEFGDISKADLVLGKCFPEFSHTIMVLSERL